MAFLSRAAVSVRPLKPYLEWAKLDDDGGQQAERVYESLRMKPHAFLLPECVDPAAQEAVLRDFWPDIFASMLNGWLRDEAQWPQPRTREMFEQWFELTWISMVEDLDPDEPLGLLE